MGDEEIKKGFAEIIAKIDKMNQDFSDMNKQISEVRKEMNLKFSKFNERLEKTWKSINDSDYRMIVQFTEVKNKIHNMTEDFDKNWFVFEHVYGPKINTISDAMLAEMEKNINTNHKVLNIETRIDRAESQIIKHEKRLFELECGPILNASKSSKNDQKE